MNITFINDSACAMFALDKATATNEPFRNVMADVGDGFADIVAGHVAAGMPSRFEVRTDKKLFEVHLAPVGGQTEIFIRNASDRLTWESALQLESEHRHLVENRFEAALSVFPIVVFNIDKNIRYTWVYNNQIALEDKAGPGRTPVEFFEPDSADRLMAFFSSVLEGKCARRAELSLRPKGAEEEQIFISSAKPLLSADGHAIGLTGASVDITNIVKQRRELEVARQEAMLAKAEADRASIAKSKFIAAASHDLRQPVQSLILLLGALRSRSMEIDIIDKMELAIDALRILLNSILDIAKLDAGVIVPDLAPVDIGTKIQRLVGEHQMRARQKGLRLTAAATSMWSLTDHSLLERVLRNLIENALRYTAKGGVVIGCRRRGDMVRIDVVDTGIGIAPAERDAVFEEFHQVGNHARDRSQGLGLGLAIVKRIVRMLGGRIEMDSTLGRGSRFSVYLPAVPAGTAPRFPAALAPPPHASTVLLIEDDPVLRGSIEILLIEWGYSPQIAMTGEMAVALVEGGVRPDIILSDYRLSNGINGIEAVQRIHAILGVQIPTLVITGDTAPERVSEVLRSGLRIAHKPIATDELRRALLSLKGGAAEGGSGTDPVPW